MLPIVARELRVRARVPSTAYARMIGAGVVLLFGTVAHLTASGTGTARMLLGLLSFLLMLFCLLEGIRQSTGLIREELREGTLGPS